MDLKASSINNAMTRGVDYWEFYVYANTSKPSSKTKNTFQHAICTLEAWAGETLIISR